MMPLKQKQKGGIKMKLIETIQFLKEKNIVDEQEKLKHIKEAEDLNGFKYLSQNELTILEELNPNNDNVIPFVIIKMISNIKGIDTKDLSLIDLSLIDEDILINHQSISNLIHEVFISLYLDQEKNNIHTIFKEYELLNEFWKKNEILMVNLIYYFSRDFCTDDNHRYFKNFNEELLNKEHTIKYVLHLSPKLLLSKKYRDVRSLFDEKKIKNMFLNLDFRNGLYKTLVIKSNTISLEGVSHLYDELDANEIELKDLIICVCDHNLVIFKRKDIVEKFKNNFEVKELLSNVNEDVIKKQLENKKHFEVIKNMAEWSKIKNKY